MKNYRFIDEPDDPPAAFVLLPDRTEAEYLTGPYYCRDDGDTMTVGFRVKKRHLNNVGVCHGGIIATFADLQGVAMKRQAHLAKNTPTINLSIDYLAPVHLGDWVEATPQVLKVTRRMLFFAAFITVAGEPIARCSGIYKISDKNRLPEA